MRIMSDRNRHRSRCLPIESMHDTRPEYSAQAGPLVKQMLEPIGQSPLLRFADRMSNQSRRLIHDEHPCVFIKHGDINRDWLQQFIRRFQQTNPHMLACEDAIRRTGEAALNPHSARPGNTLYAPRVVIPQLPDQKRIDPNAARGGINDKLISRNGVRQWSASELQRGLRSLIWQIASRSDAV